MQEVAAALVTAVAPMPLRRYYLKLKAEELLYLLLAELAKCTSVPLYSLSATDARQLYHVREHPLADLSQPPQLAAPARQAGISESKLKRLFK